MIQTNFLSELFAGALDDSTIFNIVCTELKDRDIDSSDRSSKIVLSTLKKFHKKNNDKLPSLGILSQNTNLDKSDLIFERIRRGYTDKESLLEQLTLYIKRVRSQQAIEDFTGSFSGDGDDERYAKFSSELSKIDEFSLVNNKESTNPFLEDVTQKSEETYDFSKVRFGIPVLDNLSDGGMKIGDIALFIMRSGVGKSTLLKWVGYYNSRLFKKVLHFQLEGSVEDVNIKYKQMITGLSYVDTLKNNLDKSKYKKDGIKSLLHNIKYRHNNFGQYDIEVVAFEEFGVPDMKMVEAAIDEYIEKKGVAPDVILLDSLDLISPGDGNKYGVDTQSIKIKLQNSAKIMKNLATKYKTRFVTATQADNVIFDEWNNPDFYIDRSRVAGDKNLANPFSFVVSGNRTITEKANNIIRFFVDKLRDYYGEGMKFAYYTNYDKGRFLNLAKGEINLKQKGWK